MKQTIRFSLLLVVVLLISVTGLLAQVPSTLSVTSVLRDSNGDRLQGNFVLTYRLYKSKVGTTALWEESQGVALENGILQATLGNVESMAIPFDTTYYLGIAINSGDELTPRLALTASPYALTAKHVSNEALVAGANVTLSRNSSNQVVISASGGSEPVVGNQLNAADGSPEAAVFVDNDGRVGIGRQNPNTSSALSVNGPISFTNRGDSTSAANNPLLYMFESGTENPSRAIFAHSPGQKSIGLYYDDLVDKLRFTANGKSAMTVRLDSQRVGINTDSPKEALSVGGVVQSLNGGFKFPDGTVQTSAAVTAATIWNSSGSNIFYNGGNVGIGDNSPLASLTVGNGDKLQIHGADGDIVFSDDQGSLRFANASGTSAPMIQMFQSGTNNATRMLLAHSPSFSNWGISYNDTTDAFTWIGDNIPVFQVQLAGQQRVGIGTFSPTAKLHVSTNSSAGFGHLKLTETQYDYSRITMDNNIHNNYWDLAAISDTNLTNAKFNIFHSDAGDILTVSARKRVGINDVTPAYPLEINGNGEMRTLNLYNTLPTTTTSTFNYGVIVNLGQANNTGFPRLFNLYGFSTDSDSYLTYGVYGFASNASNFNYGVYGVAGVTLGYAGYFSGNVYSSGSYVTSDEKFKSNIRTVQSGLDKVMALRPRISTFDTQRFAFMNLPEGDQYGFLAGELKEVMPELVKRSFQPYDEPTSDTDAGQGIWFDAVNYNGVIPVLVSAIQEQQATIAALQAEVNALKAAVNR